MNIFVKSELLWKKHFFQCVGSSVHNYKNLILIIIKNDRFVNMNVLSANFLLILFTFMFNSLY